MTRSLYRANLLQTLWATLKLNGFERVVFYNFADKFFFLDGDSARFIDSPEARKSTQEALENGSRQQVGPMGATRNVLARERINSSDRAQTDKPAQPHEDQKIIRMMPKHGDGDAMADSVVLTNFNDFVTDERVKTALVIEDLENLSRIHESVKRQLAIRLQKWRALPNRNSNVVIFINSREPLDLDSEQAMRNISTEFAEIANLVSVAFGEESGDASESILYIPTPFETEVERWLNTVRLRTGLSVEWREFYKLVRWLAAENSQLKDLDGKLNEYILRRNTNETTDEKLSLALARRSKWVSSDADPRPALERLEQMIGLESVKEQVRNLRFEIQAQTRRMALNPQLRIEPPNLHLAFTGNPGTGKTTVARLIGEIYRDLELLRRGHTVEVQKDDLVAGYIGQTAAQTNAKINQALDGVFFLDEAYTLKDSNENRGNDFGRDALNKIMTRMENERHRLAIILAGYGPEMTELISMNPGMSRRIGKIIHFEDYNGEELLQIFEQRAISGGLFISSETRRTMLGLFKKMYDRRNDKDFFSTDEKGKSTFGNAGEVRKLFQAMITHQAKRFGGIPQTELTLEDLPPDYQKFMPHVSKQSELAELLTELNDLVGLEKVKDFVRELVEEAQVAQLGLKISETPPTRHMIFTGNPGTGKTTVAQLLGKIYKSLGILKKGHFRQVTRADLVAEYVGQTEQKTRQVINEALDGVLLIDEAYSLARDFSDTFGKLAIDTLVPMLEDHRERLVVIFAGYTEEMKYFINANAGFVSRIGYTLEFPDYEPEMLLQILLRMTARDEFEVPKDIEEILLELFKRFHAKRGRNFGNARDVRVQFYDKMVRQFRRRILYEAEQNGVSENLSKTFVLSDLMDIEGFN